MPLPGTIHMPNCVSKDINSNNISDSGAWLNTAPCLSQYDIRKMGSGSQLHIPETLLHFQQTPPRALATTVWTTPEFIIMSQVWIPVCTISVLTQLWI